MQEWKEKTDSAATVLPDYDATPQQAPEGCERNLLTLAPAAHVGEIVGAFTFIRQAGEYFRIWIGNTFLTLTTLGRWSQWARIRKRCFFLRYT